MESTCTLLDLGVGSWIAARTTTLQQDLNHLFLFLLNTPSNRLGKYHLDFKHIMKMTWVHHLFVCVKTEKKNRAIWQNGEENGSTDTISQTVVRNAATTHLASTNAHGTWNGGSFVGNRGIKGNKWSCQIEALKDWSRFPICASGCSLKFILAGLTVVLIEKYHLGQGPFVLGAQGDRPVAPPYGPALDRVS
jgi:hypothetical protein